MSQSDNTMTVQVEAHRESSTRTAVTARNFELTVDEPEEMGGTNAGPNPLEYLLAGQAGCLNVTGQQVANDMGIEIDALDITIEGDFDIGTFQTEKPDDPTRVQNITVTMVADSDADDETIEEWAERVEKRCPVSGNIKNETSVTLAVKAD